VSAKQKRTEKEDLRSKNEEERLTVGETPRTSILKQTNSESINSAYAKAEETSAPPRGDPPQSKTGYHGGKIATGSVSRMDPGKKKKETEKDTPRLNDKSEEGSKAFQNRENVQSFMQTSCWSPDAGGQLLRRRGGGSG